VYEAQHTTAIETLNGGRAIDLRQRRMSIAKISSSDEFETCT
jgi:hypothetical protein